MDHHRCVLALLLMSMVGIIYCRPSYGSCNDTRLIVGEEPWDQFVLSLQWPFTSCKKMNCHTTINKWTIHGLWPGYSNKKTCPKCPTVAYDKSIESMSSVKSNWPDLKKTGTFWKYEWDKHGMCATEASKIDDCRDYFQTTSTTLYNNNNPQSALDAGHITPSNTKAYKTADIQSALDKKFKSPLLRCFSQGGKLYLGEIHFCFTKDLVAKSCRKAEQCGDQDTTSEDEDYGVGSYYQACPATGNVYFPSS